MDHALLDTFVTEWAVRGWRRMTYGTRIRGVDGALLFFVDFVDDVLVFHRDESRTEPLFRVSGNPLERGAIVIGPGGATLATLLRPEGGRAEEGFEVLDRTGALLGRVVYGEERKLLGARRWTDVVDLGGAVTARVEEIDRAAGRLAVEVLRHAFDARVLLACVLCSFSVLAQHGD